MPSRWQGMPEDAVDVVAAVLHERRALTRTQHCMRSHATGLTDMWKAIPRQTAARWEAAQSVHASDAFCSRLAKPVHARLICNERERRERLKTAEAYSGQPPLGANRTFLGLALVAGLFCHMSLGLVLTSMWASFTSTISIPPPPL